MPICHISTIQYVPDPIADERINIALVVISDSAARCEVITDWRRVHSFGRRTTEGLKDWVYEFKSFVEGQRPLLAPSELSVQLMTDWSSSWAISSIQISKPQPVMLDFESTLSIYASRVLRLGMRQEGANSNEKSAIISGARRALEFSLAEASNSPYIRSYVKNRVDASGRLERHPIDLGVEIDGNVYTGAYALSFRRSSPQDIERDREGILWKLSDLVNNRLSRISLAVIASPPSDSQLEEVHKSFQKLQTSCEAIRVPVVLSSTADVQQWASRQVEYLEQVGAVELMTA
jgi:hypothetical protein